MTHDQDDQPDVGQGGFNDPGLDESEVRARRALGLTRTESPRTRQWSGAETNRRSGGNGPGHHKTRFVQDGEVPVVMVSGRGARPDSLPAGGNGDRTRLAEAEAALARERTAKENAERSLREATAALHELQTRLGHAELARDEAAAAERRALEQLEATRQARTVAEAVAPATEVAEPPRRGRRPKAAQAAPYGSPVQDDARPRRRPGRPKLLAAHGPLPPDQPVRWWIGADAGDGGEDDAPPA